MSGVLRATLERYFAHYESLRSFTWRIFPRLYQDFDILADKQHYLENFNLKKIWEALGPLADTLENLSLHLEGSESTCFQFTEPDLQKFKALKHLELIYGFQVSWVNPTWYFISPNLVSLTMAVYPQALIALDSGVLENFARRAREFRAAWVHREQIALTREGALRTISACM
jgi:hypothetical protein